LLIDAGSARPDGMRCDVDGNLWVGWGMGDESSTASRSSTPTAADRPHRAPALRELMLRGAPTATGLFMTGSTGM
jgi:sugar lactone lactonase YvrE